MAARRLIDKTRERLSRETGTIYKPHAGRTTFALAFPNTYYVGMSNLGMQLIYGLLNDAEETVCERVFLPDADDIDERTPLFSMESQTPVRDFDVLAFTLSFEPDYPNLLKILALSGLPARSSERSEKHPLVIAGGPAVTFNPEPLAEFVDVFVIGEAEAVLPGFVETLEKHLDEDRKALLCSLAQLPGVYVPSLYEPQYAGDGTIESMRVLPGAPGKIKRQWVPELGAHPAVSRILTPETEFSNMVLAEVARGCGRQCRFCIAGYAFLPPRAREHDEVMAAIGSTPSESRVGLLSASVFDHPSSLLVCQSLIEKERLFSISSTRADTLNADIVEALRKGGHSTLTIAPEAGTERLRNVINKCMTDDDVMHAAETAWDGGFKRLKLYFMVGLPTETDEDIDGIISLVTAIAGLHPWEHIGVSASCFVPKPWTPFQWAPMNDEKVLAKKVTGIRQALRPVRRVDISGESAREAVVQGVLARGDRRVGNALLAYSGGNMSWRAAFREGGIEPCFYANRARTRQEVLPWDHIDLGVRKDYLWREYERSMEGAQSTYCRVGRCKRCGICR